MFNGSSFPLHPCTRFVFTFLRYNRRHALRKFPCEKLSCNVLTIFDRIMKYRRTDNFLVIGHRRHNISYFYRMDNVRPLRPLSQLSFMCFGCKFNGFVDHLISLLIVFHLFHKSCLFSFVEKREDTRNYYQG